MDIERWDGGEGKYWGQKGRGGEGWREEESMWDGRVGTEEGRKQIGAGKIENDYLTK